jgi:hypothetical protein
VRGSRTPASPPGSRRTHTVTLSQRVTLTPGAGSCAKLGTASKVDDQYLGKEAQGQFVLVYVTVKNIGKEPQLFSGEAQKLFEATGKEFSADSEAAISMGDASNSLYEEINPGNSVKGIVVFDIPKGTDVASIELHDSPFSGGTKVSLS